MLLAFEQLMRLSELATTPVPSVAQRNPLRLSDRRYVDSRGRDVAFDERGRPVLPSGGVTVERCVMRMPPSKTDVVGAVDGLVLPFPKGWTPSCTKSPTAAGPALWRRDCQFPVPLEYQPAVPLFGMEAWARGGREVVQFSQQRFRTVRNQLCRLARPAVRYQGS